MVVKRRIPPLVLPRRVSIEMISGGRISSSFFHARFSLESGACIYTGSYRGRGGTLEAERAILLAVVGRLQRGNKGVHCRVYRGLRTAVQQRHAVAAESGTRLGLFRIRFSCRGGFADRDDG